MINWFVEALLYGECVRLNQHYDINKHSWLDFKSRGKVKQIFLDKYYSDSLKKDNYKAFSNNAHQFMIY